MSSGSTRWTAGLAERLGVPADLGLVYEFVNSVDHRCFVYRGQRNVGGDELADRRGLRLWLVERGLLPGRRVRVSTEDLAAARALRTGLREAISRHGAAFSSDPVGTAFAGAPLIVHADPGGGLGLRPEAAGVTAAVSAVLIEAVITSATGQWARLKMCGAPDCRWVFFDASKPAAARWCETDICGNRMKKSNQRARRRAAAASSEP